MKNSKKLTLAGMFTALTALLTYFPQIPVATGGYIHLGDSLIYTAAIVYGGLFGAVTAGVGSAIADLLSGYAIYAIPTLIIKGIMGFTVGKLSDNSGKATIRNIIAMVIGGLIMIVGYGAYDMFLATSNGENAFAVLTYSIFMNLIQYFFGVLLGIFILFAINKAKIIKK